MNNFDNDNHNSALELPKLDVKEEEKAASYIEKITMSTDINTYETSDLKRMPEGSNTVTSISKIKESFVFYQGRCKIVYLANKAFPLFVIGPDRQLPSILQMVVTFLLLSWYWIFGFQIKSLFVWIFFFTNLFAYIISYSCLFLMNPG